MPPANKGARGYTLSEIMTVIVILGVVAALALPNYNIQVKKVKNQEAIQVLLALYEAQKDEKEYHGKYADRIEDLDVDIEGLKNFIGLDVTSDATICNGHQYLASVQATDGDYILYVLEKNATIACTDTSGNCSAPLCVKMGFKNLLNLGTEEYAYPNN